MKSEWVLTVMALALLGVFFYGQEPSPPDSVVSTPASSSGGEVVIHTVSEMPVSGRARRVSGAIPTGEPLIVDLIESPAKEFGGVVWTESDRAYAEILDALPFIDYDPDLGHAARELAHIYSVEDALVPSDALAFLTTSAGATVWTVRQSFTATSRDGDEPILERVRTLIDAEPDDGRPMRIGVGEAYEIGASPPRTIAVLLSRSELYIDPAPRRVSLGSSFSLSGSLPLGAKEVRVLSMGPEFVIGEPSVEVVGDRFQTTIAAGDTEGPLWVELVATLPSGPMPLAQLEIQVGGVVPHRWDGHYPPDEGMIRSTADAERVAASLVNMDRETHGRPVLIRDASLDAIARAHSDDMATQGFFGHRSPTTGMAGDRIRRAGYRTSAYGENVALNRSVWSAEKGLMYSLGHRKNILSEGYTHMGIGVHMAETRGIRRYHLTQLFGRPPVPIIPKRDREKLYGLVKRAFAERGLAPPVMHTELTRIGDVHAARDGGTIGSALEQARGTRLGLGRLYGWSHQVSGFSQLSVPEDAFAHSYRWIGIGLAQDLTGPPPTIKLVVLLAQ